MENKPRHFFDNIPHGEDRKNLFWQSKYNPKYYEAVKDLYSNSNALYITHLKYLPPKYSEEFDKQIKLETLKDFEEFIWDSFADIVDKYNKDFLFGIGGMKNLNPHRVKEIYYDGMTFYTTREEYLEMIRDTKNNLDFSRICSFLAHFGLRDGYFSDEKFEGKVDTTQK